MTGASIVLVGGCLVLAACSNDGPTTDTTTVTGGTTTVTDGAESTGLDSAGREGDRGEAVVEAGIPPDVDTQRHSVPLDEVVFDTFDGDSVTLPESTPELRARLLDAIPPIDAPPYDEVSGVDWLEPDDLVVGLVGERATFAYPVKILNGHEIVNEVIDGVPLLVSYCPLCRSAIVYDRRVDGEVLSFSNTSALHESDLVMVDRQTGSYWWQVLGTAIVGPLTLTELTVLPSEMATWSDWTERHPETLVLSRDLGHRRNYESDSFAAYADVIDSGRFAFPVGEAARNDRLAASALVVVVEIGDETIAFPVDDLAQPFDDIVAGQRIRVVPHDGGAEVFEVTAAGDRLPIRTSFWFAVAGAYPDVAVRSG